MIEGINLLISIFIGCIVFIYYTNALFKPRTKYLYANISIIVGYMMLYAISSFYQPTLNVIAFSIATFVLMYLCFKVTLKNAIIQAFMLTAIMMLAEGVLFMFTGIGIYPKGLLDVSLSARIIHAVLSKLIYFLGIIIAKHVAKGKSKYEEIDGFLSLLAIPFFTIMVIVSIMSVFPQINERIRVIFALIIVFGIIANIIVYWVHERTLQYQKEIQDFQEQQYKNTLELAYCHMLEEKLSQTRIMRHDFREHLKVLETYIQTDIRSAIDYLKSIKIRNEEIGVINYTTNKVLNILLSEKQKICTEKEITLKIHTTDVNFDFMKDIDIISMIIIGIITHRLWECVLFCLIYKIIRKYTGGFHFESAVCCYISSCIMYLVAIVIITYIPFRIYGISAMVLISAIIIWGLSPVEAVNKPLDECEKQVFKKRARFNIVIIVITYMVSLFISNELAYIIGISVISVMLFAIIGKIKLIAVTESKKKVI